MRANSSGREKMAGCHDIKNNFDENLFFDLTGVYIIYL